MKYNEAATNQDNMGRALCEISESMKEIEKYYKNKNHQEFGED